MKIPYEKKRIMAFSKMLLAHPFDELRGLTSSYRAFEEPDLSAVMKDSFLRKLSVANPLCLPSFTNFWEWVRKNHGMALVGQMCAFLFPGDDPEFKKMVNRVRANKEHAFWKHIKARVYKKWCSIMTEAQCVYAMLTGIEKAGLDWSILASAELDGVGIDFVLVTAHQAIPVQIKKDTYSRYAVTKKNSMENFGRFDIRGKAMATLKKHLKDAKFEGHIEQAMILKYGLKDRVTKKLPYSYLGEFSNGFVYFKSDAIVASIEEIINRNNVVEFKKAA